MIELYGKHNTAKIFTDIIDNETVSQIITLLNQKFVEESQVRIMSDCHAGAGCVIGTTMTLHRKVVPNLVGVDVGCFVADTKVWCTSGGYKPIKTLADSREPFLTESFDEKRKCFVKAPAVAKLTRRNAELVAVTYTLNRMTGNHDIKVKCTPDHKFLVCEEHTGHMPNYKKRTCVWVEAKDLTPDMQLVAEDDYVTVKNVKPLSKKRDVYCLTVADTHNFTIEGGIIVHNCGMLTVKLAEKTGDIDMEKLDSVIREYVPSGFRVHDESHASDTPLDCTELRCFREAGINDILAYRSVGTLGGGEVLASGRINSPA